MTPITEHNRYPRNGQKRAHRQVAEITLGRALPANAVIHHHGANRAIHDKNLVICENQGYHTLLEQRTRAFYACGNANALRCIHCGHYDGAENLRVYIMKRGPRKGKSFAQHSLCHKEHMQRRRDAIA